LIQLEYLGLAILDGLVNGFSIALIASGLTIVFGIINIVNLAHGELYMLGALVSWVLVSAGLGYGSALIVAPLVVSGMAVLLNMLILQRFGHEPGPTMLATFGILLIIQQAGLAILGPAPRAISPPFNPPVEVGGFSYSGFKLFIGLASLATCLLVSVIFDKSRLGTLLRAVQENRLMVGSLGIDAGRVIMIGFALAGGLAGLAGALNSPVRQIHFLMGFDALVASFVVVVLGGMGSLRGTLTAAVALGLLESLTALFLAPTASRVVSMLIALSYVAVRRLGQAGGGSRS